MNKQKQVQLPSIVSRKEWLKARKDLLVKEKKFTREREPLNAERRRLPMVEIEKDYVLDGLNGKVRLLDLLRIVPSLLFIILCLILNGRQAVRHVHWRLTIWGIFPICMRVIHRLL